MPNLGRRSSLADVVLSCPRCGGDFTPRRKDQTYCSTECRRRREFVSAVCRREACGKEFAAAHGNQAYCSGACRQQAWVELNRVKAEVQESTARRTAGSSGWATTVWWRLFRISEDAAYEMIAFQDNKCASCGVEFIFGESKGKGNSAPVLDHCHVTGVGRGVICSRCNRILGLAGDDPEVLTRAAEYLASPPLSIVPRSHVAGVGDLPVATDGLD